MTARLTVPLGVIVVREANEHPWEEFRWRAAGVYLDAPEKADWRQHMHLLGSAQFYSATVPLVLQRKETISYRVNLANGEPSLYIVMRHETVRPATQPILFRCVTASPFEAQACCDVALDWVDRVPMPARLVAMVEDFLACDCLGEDAFDAADAAAAEGADAQFESEAASTRVVPRDL